MKCIIPDIGLHAFGKAIHCLCKIGEEIFIETRQHGVSFKTVNSARSAYVCFEFTRNFFDSYKSGSTVDKSDNVFCCKVLSKSLLLVFRGLSSLEKTVNQCHISIDTDSSMLAVIFHCKHGITKRHKVNYNDCEMLKAVYNKENCFNHLGGASRALSDAVVNFPNSQDEVTLIASKDNIKLKNYTEDIGDNRSITTEIFLLSEEFDSFVISKETSITFCLKELRVILAFTDSMDDCLNISFESCGRPVVLSIDDNPQYTADILLASLMENSEEDERTQCETNTCTESKAIPHETNNKRHTQEHESSIPTVRASDRGSTVRTNEADITYPSVLDYLLPDNEDELVTDSHGATCTYKSSINDELSISSNSQNTGVMNKRSLEPIPSDDEMECSGLVPSTPPQPKKFKSLFTIQDMFGGQQETDSILALDSEDEEL